MNNQKGLAPIAIVIILAVLVGGYLFYQQQTKTITPQSDSLKAYTNTESIRYQVSYPSDWEIQAHKSRIEPDAEGITFIHSKQEGERISLRCPRSIGVDYIKLPNPKDYLPNEGNYIIKFEKDIEVNGAKGLQYIWGNDEVDYLHTALQKDTNSPVCELSQFIKVANNNYQQTVDSQRVYNQILSTFKFTN